MPETALPDLTSVRENVRNARSSALEQMRICVEVAQSTRCEKAFIRPMFDQALASAGNLHLHARPLAGLAVSVKDLFDIEGQVTGAGSRIRSAQEPATRDCPAVARLRQCGAVILGRTNMTEFAFSGVGINPHFGTPANAASQGEPLIPGGSSSGAAVSVATGAAFVGLGSDTAGSIRIPAALNGIVGFKNTARLVPTEGAFPLSTTLDTVCAMTRSVSDAIAVHEVLAAQTVTRSNAPLSAYRLAVVGTLMHDVLDSTVSRAYAAALDRLRAAGAHIIDIDLPELNTVSDLLQHGGFAGAESYALHRQSLAIAADKIDPRVVARIVRGNEMSAADYVDLLLARRNWMEIMNRQLQGFDAVLSPTLPIVAPAIAALAPGKERDEEFFRINALLLRNTGVVNLLDGCALSLPCQQRGDLPVGLMVWHGALHDDTVLNIGMQIEQALGA